jgi:hypothetical protein
VRAAARSRYRCSRCSDGPLSGVFMRPSDSGAVLGLQTAYCYTSYQYCNSVIALTGENRGKSTHRFRCSNSSKCNSHDKATPRVPQRARNRAADGRRQGEPPWPSGCDGDPTGLSPWPARQRACRPPVGDDLDLAHGRLHVRRSKGGETAVHPLGGKEMRALRRLQRETTAKSAYVFISERGSPLSVAGYQRMVARAGVTARFPFLIHSHMLRHSCATSSPMTATTRGQFKDISAIAQSSVHSATQPWLRIGSSGSGSTKE